MTFRWFPLLALLLAAPAAADPLEGSWALEAGGTAIFRFDLSKGEDGKWHGDWSKPTSFASDGNRFSRLKGPPKQVQAMTAIETPNGIELSFDDPRPGAIPDIFDFKAIDPDAIEMTYVGTDLPPYTLERVKPDAAIGPWDPDKSYSREGSEPDDSTPSKPAVETSPEAPPAVETPPEATPPINKSSFRLKPGAPVGR
jgi:hypothetical protein